MKGYAGMCANIAGAVQDKTKFVEQKVNFMEQCEDQLLKIIDNFDEQIDQLTEINDYVGV